MNIQNRSLFHGDNLGFLRAINSETIDLIATDPPFNKGKDFHATPDSLAAGASFQDQWNWDDDVERAWIDKLEDDFRPVMEAVHSAYHSHSPGMGAFMCYMAVRLLEMRRVLKPTGSIYLHCDPTASNYLRSIMNAIFGAANFRNEIVWSYTGPGGASRRGFRRKHDVILFYSKGEKAVFNIQYDAPSERQRQLVKAGYQRASMAGVKQVRIYDPEHPVVREKMPQWEKEGVKIYYQEVKGIPLDAVWTMPIIGPTSSERTGYPTQKPIALYERIIEASSNPGDFVLDPFCGCATTLVAAERLGRQWAGIDIWDKARELVEDRLKRDADLQKSDGTAKDMFPNGKIGYFTEPPKRTDDGLEAAPTLKTKVKYAQREPDGPRQSRAEMLAELIEKFGSRCQGCNRFFDDPRYLQLDHNTPRADGGVNHISNRILLCGPCNQLKSNLLTLSGLRRENEKRGYMK